jgi:class 3 adenylate cyclase
MQTVPDGLNPELKRYLPPHLWRKLVEDSARKGVLNNALDRMQSLRYTISTYLPGDLVREKMKDPRAGVVDGKILNGCLLFSDVSGFTTLSERLAELGPKGAEALTEAINLYFTEMIDILSRSSGTLLKFAGDATLVFFPEQESGEHIQWAARAGLRMMRAMQKFSNMRLPLLDQDVTIAMKIGLSAGSFLAASVGSEQRMEYALIGSTVSQTLQAEACTTPGDIVANQNAANLLSSTYEMLEIKDKPGFYLLKPGDNRELDEYEITRTERRRSRSSAVQWDTSLDEIKNKINEELVQVKALTPYLASELVERIVVHADQRQLRSEYRPTTVMFCNFTGPDELLDLWGEAGAKRVTRILNDYFTAINEVIHRFGGIVSRIDPYSHGTKLLALFGAPVAHEDDAQRAISAALEMNRALSALNREWAQSMSRYLPTGGKRIFVEHRIGITLGNTFAGQAGASMRREYTVMGDEVNLAARLMSAASAGQILISWPVQEATEDYFVARNLPPITVKGKKNPIEIWQVDGLREDTLINRIHKRPPLIGRISEFERGWQFIQRAHDGGTKNNVLTVTGPAGIGKSHLADALIKKALEDGWQFHAFQCRSYLAEEAHSCWKGVLRSLAGITATDHLLIQKEKLDSLIEPFNLTEEQTEALVEMMKLSEARSALEMSQESGKWSKGDILNVLKEETKRKPWDSKILNKLIGDRASSKRDLPQQTGGKATDQQQATLIAVLSAASTKPLIIFFEDAQWMDEGSKSYLEAISREVISRPIVFLLASRTRESDGDRNSDRIELAPFNRTETQAMIAEILTSGLADIIHEQSNGSPLFVEEISSWIKQTHNIDVERIKDVLQTSDVLQKLVLSRLESLPEGQREVARLASVIGVEFCDDELRTLIPETIDPTTLEEYLNDLKNAELIAFREYGTDRHYIFSQPIFRDVLYTSLPFERRIELHDVVAKYLVKNQPEEAEANSLPAIEKLAYHYEKSEQWLEAARQLRLAAEAANQPQITAEALHNRALKLLKNYPPEKVDAAIGYEKAHAQLALGSFALTRFDLAAAAAAHEAALSALPSDAQPEKTIRIVCRLCMLLPSQGKTEAAEKYLARALRQYPNDWRLLAVSAWLEWRSRRNPASQIEACRASLPEVETESTLRARALMNDLSGGWLQAAESYQALNESNSTALAWVQLGDQLLKEKNHPEALKQYEQAAMIWQDTDFCGMALTLYRQAELELLERRKAKAVALLKESLSLLEKSTSTLRAEPRGAIQKALTMINARNYGEWKYWRWQPFDDLIRIQFLLPLFQEVK